MYRIKVNRTKKEIVEELQSLSGISFKFSLLFFKEEGYLLIKKNVNGCRG